MSDFSEKLQRSLDAADYLIQAANTADPALRQRLTLIAYDLLGDAENLPPGDAGRSNDGTLVLADN